MDTTVIQGDPLWQKVAGVVALLLILWNIRDGYRKGGWKKISGLVALLAAYAGAFFLNAPLAKAVQSYLPYPQLLVRALCGTLAALAVYVLAKWVLGLLNFKDTQDDVAHSKTGALAGLFVGAICVLALWIALRFVGNFAQTALDARGLTPAETTTQHPVIANLIKAKDSVEMGAASEIIAALDPVPDAVYRMTEKTVRLLGSPEARRILAQNPQLKPLLEDPLVVAVTQDAEVRRLVDERNFHTLLRNEKVRKLADNEAIRAKLASLDFEAALDAALAQAPAPENAPASEKAPAPNAEVR